MFHRNLGQYFSGKYGKDSKLPHVEVTREEFIRLYVEDGGSPVAAKTRADISESLGAHTKIGDKWVAVKKGERPDSVL